MSAPNLNSLQGLTVVIKSKTPTTLLFGSC